MRNETPFHRLWMLWILLLLTACAGVGTIDNDGSNPLTPTPPVPVFGDFVLGVAASTPASGSVSRFSKLLSIQGGGIEIEETRNAISDISFKAEGGSENEIEFPGTFVVELIGDGGILNQEFPDFGITQIPFGDYDRFEMRFEKLESEEIPSELLDDPLVSNLLVDNAFVVTGTFQELDGHDVNGNGQVDRVPFQIISDNSVHIEVSSPNFFTVESDRVNFFFIAFQLEGWFAGLLPQFQGLDPEDLSGGVALVQDGSGNNKIDAILESFEENTEISCKSAPSDDDQFEEGDVDEDSSSGPV